MTELQFNNLAHQHVMNFETELINSALEKSMGEAEMSPADVKLAILALKGICDHQEKMIQQLVKATDVKKKRHRWNLFR